MQGKAHRQLLSAKLGVASQSSKGIGTVMLQEEGCVEQVGGAARVGLTPPVGSCDQE